jgi:hypothetical protein
LSISGSHQVETPRVDLVGDDPPRPQPPLPAAAIVAGQLRRRGARRLGPAITSGRRRNGPARRQRQDGQRRGNPADHAGAINTALPMAWRF